MADAVVLPGRMFGPAAPLPMYAGDVAERRGAKVHRHSWSQEPPESSDPAVQGWVHAEATTVLDGLDGPPLLIAKRSRTLTTACTCRAR